MFCPDPMRSPPSSRPGAPPPAAPTVQGPALPQSLRIGRRNGHHEASAASPRSLPGPPRSSLSLLRPHGARAGRPGRRKAQAASPRCKNQRRDRRCGEAAVDLANAVGSTTSQLLCQTHFIYRTCISRFML